MYESSDDHLGARMEDGVHLQVPQAEVEELLLRVTEKGVESGNSQREVDEDVAGVLGRH